MKTYQVLLTKSYTVTVKAETEEMARDVSEFYTGDIIDLSTKEDRESENFQIKEIECCQNDSFDCIEIEEQE